MRHRILENDEMNRIAVLIETPDDDKLVDAAIAYANDCGEPIFEDESLKQPEIDSIIAKGFEKRANEVHEYFNLDRDD